MILIWILIKNRFLCHNTNSLCFAFDATTVGNVLTDDVRESISICFFRNKLKVLPLHQSIPTIVSIFALSLLWCLAVFQSLGYRFGVVSP